MPFLGELYGKAGNRAEARRLLKGLMSFTPSLAEKKLLRDKAGNDFSG